MEKKILVIKDSFNGLSSSVEIVEIIIRKIRQSGNARKGDIIKDNISYKGQMHQVFTIPCNSNFANANGSKTGYASCITY